MKTELHPAKERGNADYDWLKTYYSFSFNTYFNPLRERFGCLRVINDDTISGGTGFDLHPHNNMEIITIMLDGALEHRDSMGNTQVINKNEIQVMSAGSGIYHAEYNHSQTEEVRLFQIWIFPREKGLKPRYDQQMFPEDATYNKLLTIVTPDNAQQDGTMWIHQDAYLSTINQKSGDTFDYQVKIPGNGVFTFVIEGKAIVAGNLLGRRDAIGISETNSFQIEATDESKVLLIEVPMK